MTTHCKSNRRRHARVTLIGLILCTTLFTLGGYGDGQSSREPEVDALPSTALNDTGRTSCSGNSETTAKVACPVIGAPGQDAEFGRDFRAGAGELIKVGGGDAGFDFNKLGSDGMPLLIQDRGWSADGDEASGTQWPCVLDNTTGLTWEIKHTDITHARYGLSTYNWYSSDATTNGGVAGTPDLGECNAGRCDSEGYIAYINSVSLCGYSDWRLPTVSEFYSLGHKGREDPAIDEDYFPNTLGALRYWSADTSAEVPQNAWYMYFSDASISFTSKDNASFVRLVRAEPEVE